MSLHIDNAALEARIREEMLATGANSAEEVLQRLLDLGVQVRSASLWLYPVERSVHEALSEALATGGQSEVSASPWSSSATDSRQEMKALLAERFHLISQKYIRGLERAEIDRLEVLESQLAECDEAEAEADRQAFPNSPAGRLMECLQRLEEYVDRLSADSK